MPVSERLRQLRLEKKLTKKAFVKEIGINYSTYANYESGAREPDSNVLRAFSKFYDVSIDFLLGLTDERRHYNRSLDITASNYGNAPDMTTNHSGFDPSGSYLFTDGLVIRTDTLSEESRKALFSFYNYLLEQDKKDSE